MRKEIFIFQGIENFKFDWFYDVYKTEVFALEEKEIIVWPLGELKFSLIFTKTLTKMLLTFPNLGVIDC